MAFFNEFPFARTYDSDLGWLIRRIQEVSRIVDEYVSLNSIQFADPINWDITAQYPRLTIVLDRDGGAYISRQPVPAGVPLTNTDYWTEIYNTTAVIDSIRGNIAHDNGDVDTATELIADGNLFWYAGDLYIAVGDIAAGNRFVVGTNCRRMTVDEKINLAAQTVEDAISQEAQARAEADSALGQQIGAEVQARVEADAALRDRIAAEEQARAAADETLTSAVQSNTSKIEVLEAAQHFKLRFQQRQILILGDSLSVAGSTWSTPFEWLMNQWGSTVENLSVGGQTIAGTLTSVNALTHGYDIVILWVGVNDSYLHHDVGSIGASTSFAGVYRQVITKLLELNPSTVIYCFGVSYYGTEQFSRKYSPHYYSAAIHSIANLYGCIYKSMAHLRGAAVYNTNALNADVIHFKESYQNRELFDAVLAALMDNRSDEGTDVYQLNIQDFTAGYGVTLGVVTGIVDFGKYTAFAAGFVVGTGGLVANATIATCDFNMDMPVSGFGIIVGATSAMAQVQQGNTIRTMSPLPAGSYSLFVTSAAGYGNLPTFSRA